TPRSTEPWKVSVCSPVRPTGSRPVQVATPEASAWRLSVSTIGSEYTTTVMPASFGSKPSPVAVISPPARRPSSDSGSTVSPVVAGGSDGTGGAATNAATVRVPAPAELGEPITKLTGSSAVPAG